MPEFLKRFTQKPSAKEMAINDLAEAQRQILVHQASSKYHTKMTEYYQDTITRLTAHIAKE